MKKFILITMVLTSFMIHSTNAYSRDLIVGLSPYMEKTASKEQIKAVIGFLLESVEPGNSARIYDAYRLSSIGTFAVPNKKAYRHQKAKLLVNKRVVKKLLQFANNAVKPGGENMPSVTGAIRLPQFLRFLGENLSLNKETDILILGSPLYDSPTEKDFSMARGHVPSDGHLQVSMGQSLFGMTGNTELLRNFHVHLAYPNTGLKLEDIQGFFVKRFWTLFLERQGGQLATFTSDLPTLFQRLKEKAQAPKHNYVLRQNDKLEMILYRPKEIKKRVSIYERPLSTIPVSLTSMKQANNVEVSITWDCKKCDLDLYARPNPRAATIYFRNSESEEGKYIKDFRGSPQASNSFETIIFHKPIDLGQLVLAVNFFAGNVRDHINGEFRISIDNKTFGRKFQIKATRGNKGACIKETMKRRKATSLQCLIIDPLKIISIRK